MALLFADGFDHYATADVLEYWTSGGIGSVGAFGRHSTNGLRNANLLYKALPNVSSVIAIVGVAANFTTIGGATQRFCQIMDLVGGSNLVQVDCFVRTDGKIQVDVAAGSFISTAVLTAATFYYLEVKAVISNTVGSFQVKVNGTAVLTQTGIDTQTGGANTEWNGVRFSGTAMDIDDLYVCDGSGSVNLDYLGDTRVETLRPVTDAVNAGMNAGLTPSTGTDRGALVDEATPNADTDYNSSAAAGVKDTYRHGSMVSTGQIAGAIVVGNVRKSDNGTKTACAVLRHAGTDYDGATVGLPVSYAYLRDIYETNPLGAPWLAAAINATEIGLKTVV